MKREAMIAHLVLHGWEPVAYESDKPLPYVLLHIDSRVVMFIDHKGAPIKMLSEPPYPQGSWDDFSDRTLLRFMEFWR